jgi:hypothetical protein
MVRVCTCETVLQWGFDETSIDGVPTLNQWVLLKEEGLAPSVATIECAGILVGSTSREIADHIRDSWRKGQVAVEMLRVHEPTCTRSKKASGSHHERSC